VETQFQTEDVEGMKEGSQTRDLNCVSRLYYEAYSIAVLAWSLSMAIYRTPNLMCPDRKKVSQKQLSVHGKVREFYFSREKQCGLQRIIEFDLP
jgi:hypothetical protein